MESLTVAIDAETLDAARLQAERRNTSLDQMVSDYVASVAHGGERDEASLKADREENRHRLLELINQGVLGDLGKLPTRDEIYAERTRWPRS